MNVMNAQLTVTNFTKALLEIFKEGGLPEPSEKQLIQFERYYNYLTEQNKLLNLTAIIDPANAALNHFYDSAMPVNLIEDGERVIDIGTGAGFPVSPLAIMQPKAEYDALDSTLKKCDFVKRACELSDIEIEVICGRAEDIAKGELRESFDICVSRAVARLNVLIELAAPFIKTGGRFFAYKSDPAEIEEAERAAEVLCLNLELCVPSLIKGNGHKVFVYRKTAETPKKYPRQFAKIKKSPL